MIFWFSVYFYFFPSIFLFLLPYFSILCCLILVFGLFCFVLFAVYFVQENVHLQSVTGGFQRVWSMGWCLEFGVDVFQCLRLRGSGDWVKGVGVEEGLGSRRLPPKPSVFCVLFSGVWLLVFSFWCLDSGGGLLVSGFGFRFSVFGSWG